MPRPKCCRRVDITPVCRLYRPEGGGSGRFYRLELEELEALRLVDAEGMHQQEAAARMGVSRATFGRIVSQARSTVAVALLSGSGLQLGEKASCCLAGGGNSCRRQRCWLEEPEGN